MITESKSGTKSSVLLGPSPVRRFTVSNRAVDLVPEARSHEFPRTPDLDAVRCGWFLAGFLAGSWPLFLVGGHGLGSGGTRFPRHFVRLARSGNWAEEPGFSFALHDFACRNSFLVHHLVPPLVPFFLLRTRSPTPILGPQARGFVFPSVLQCCS